ncbi:MAG: homoserine dehydrogenase [Candidatus Azotimanducaceae bacterium]|jgi:homoserine dehydrogenase
MTKVNIGICGLGTVGSGTFNLVNANANEIKRKTGIDLTISHVGCRRDHPDCDLGNVKVSRDVFEVVNDPDVHVICELIGGDDVALELVKQAIAYGKHVVTANKALIAVHGDELFALANAKGVSIMFEAAIAGGIPIVKALREGLAGNQVHWVAGIINGTSNFILSEMESAGNRAFEEVLKEAQDLGYAEADPTFDVEGIDAAHKLTILSSLAFGVPLNFAAMYTEGISKITVEDIRYADELGFKIKHLGITRKVVDESSNSASIELRVHPTLVPKSQMLSQVAGVMNAVMVGSDAAGATMYYGAGAGAGPTASSVVSDLIDLARIVVNSRASGESAAEQVQNLGFVPEAMQALPIVPISETVSCYYLRLKVHDDSGVLARITTILSEQGIGIDSMIQKDAKSGRALIALVTDSVVESSIDEAIVKLEAMGVVDGKIAMIRVEMF